VGIKINQKNTLIDRGYQKIVSDVINNQNFVSKKQEMSFDDIGDIKDIVHLNNLEMENRDGDKGFIMFPLDEISLGWIMLNNKMFKNGGTITKRDENGKIQGFLMYMKLSGKSAKEIMGVKEIIEYNPNIDLKKGVFISKVVTHPEYRNMGIARELVEKMVEKTNPSFIASTVICSPVLNKASVAFHEKNGFQQIVKDLSEYEFMNETYGETDPDIDETVIISEIEEEELKKVKSILFLKELN